MRLFAFVLAALPTACLWSGCGRTDSSPEKEPSPEVTITKVQNGAIHESLLVSGNLVTLPNRDAKITAMVPGRIQSVLVTEGDPVQSGQVLAHLDNASLRDQQVQAEAAVSQAKANVENSKLAADREAGLLQRGISSRKEVEDTRTQLSVNQSLLKQAEASASAARTQVGRSVLRAPFAGVVVHRFLGNGEQVDGSSTQPVLEVADISVLELLGTVPASRLSEVRAGTEFTFQTTAVPNATFPARVIAVSPAVDPLTDNGTMRIRITNSKRLLKLGMFLSVELPLKQVPTGLVVPKQAIYPDETGEPHVYRLTGNEAKFIPVELGVQTKDQAQILSGVNEGDTVILSGGYGLPEKSTVRLKP
jgi:membrane fusion protein, multidrug efflux system